MKRLLFVTAVLIESCLASRQALADAPFDFETARAKAKALSEKPYEAPKSRLPKSLENLTYDQYRDIRFDPFKAWWLSDRLPFLLHFFHPGFIHRETVQVSEIDKGQVKPIEFSTKFFTYERLKDLGNIPGDIGFSGLRVHYPLNSPGYFDELIVFQGASYFRALGQGMRWGLSARGLALNTVDPQPEEFPVFTEFWVQKPTPDAKDLVIYALLDSPSVAGAFRFRIVPGPSTVVDVHTAIYRREGAKVSTFGAAPLTSMFWFGENTPVHHPDLRPEVHDSDGLMMERGNGEWIWRPLVNPTKVQS
jgi:glucans biosynthesis protein